MASARSVPPGATADLTEARPGGPGRRIDRAMAPGTPIARAVTPSAADWVQAGQPGAVVTLTRPRLVENPTLVGASHAVLTGLARHAAFVAPAAQVVELDDAWVWGTEGAVVTTDGCLVEDLTRVSGRSLDEHPIWVSGYQGHLELPGTSAVVAARAAAHNFSHFLADTLPRIELVIRAGVEIDHWLVSAKHHAWQRSAFELLGLEPSRLVAMDHNELVRCGRLVVPSRTGFAPRTAPWARELLRSRLGGSPAVRGRRLLLSRAGSTWRRLLNEAEIDAALAPYGFELVALDRFGLAEQLNIMSESAVVVAPHGAALSHLIAVPDGGTVVEIAAPTAIHPEYHNLAGLAGWTYRMLLSTGLDDIGEPVAVLRDLWCDPSLIVRTLREAGVDL